LAARRSEDRLAPVVGCVVGLLAGVGAGLLQHASYSSTSTVVVEVQGLPAPGSMGPTGADVATTVAALATSNTAVDNVAQAQHLSSSAVRDHLRASVVDRTALVRLRYSDRSRTRAEAVVHEAGTVLRALAVSQFAAGPRKLTVAEVDPPRTRRDSRPVLRDALLGALIGAAAGFLVLLARRERVRPPVRTGSGDSPRDTAEPPPPPEEPVPLEPQPVRPAPPPRAAEPPAPPAGPPREVPELAAVRRALAEHGHEFDQDEVTFWEAYVGGLEAQAVDGRLPERLRALIPDVFGPLLARGSDSQA
jgi:hypothetical protein